ncbi:hypothetical protein LDL36_18400 [Komagataeibacter sp. FNDCR1]|nr:hypothetical protein [Komagataeibacter sp. FNDCR1]
MTSPTSLGLTWLASLRAISGTSLTGAVAKVLTRTSLMRPCPIIVPKDDDFFRGSLETVLSHPGMLHTTTMAAQSASWLTTMPFEAKADAAETNSDVMTALL